MDTTTTPFVVTKAQPSFDWNHFLDREDITANEWFKAEELAGSWITCACGNQCAAIPREKLTSQPLDSQLAHLGGIFFTAIAERDTELAKNILHDIELRSAYLLSQLVIK